MVIKKSSIFPIDVLMKFSVSLLCSPVKFCSSPFGNFLKNSNSVLTVQSPDFDFFRSICLAMIYSSPSIKISPFTETLLLSVNLLNISSAFWVLVVVLKNKNSNRSTVSTVFPPKLGGSDSITVIPLHLSKSRTWFSP